MENVPNCPQCQSEYTYEDGDYSSVLNVLTNGLQLNKQTSRLAKQLQIRMGMSLRTVTQLSLSKI